MHDGWLTEFYVHCAIKFPHHHENFRVSYWSAKFGEGILNHARVIMIWRLSVQLEL